MNDEVIVLRTQYSQGRFSADPFDNRPPWLNVAIKNNFIAVVPLPEKKYGRYQSVWAVRQNDGLIQIAEPGDRINYDMMFGLIVTKVRTNTLTWDDVKPKTPKKTTSKEVEQQNTPDDSDPADSAPSTEEV